MHIDGKHILIAGGNGLAGTHVVNSILAASADARIRATYRTKRGVFIDDTRVEYIQADFRNPDDCRRAAKGCDCAVLTAAQTGGSAASKAAPWEQVSNNAVIDIQLLEALHAEGVRRTVYVSTASVYQEFEGYIREDQLDLNADPHEAHIGVGWAKRYVEKLCRFWHEKAGMEILIARLANIYGPYASFDPSKSHFVAALIRKAADRMDPFEVWGSPNVTRDI
ncbi:MAG: NAD-dependent epimerase/dehydratase family protein, partial [Rhodospirillales bacterium]|nr:NAD-dependent epimerase/dehydratase family protein [Rhodospirillales bacterium]